MEPPLPMEGMDPEGEAEGEVEARTEADTFSDPYELRRFTSAQRKYHSSAVKELRAGAKSSCWAWYILPTPPFIANGRMVGSLLNQRYQLATDDEARAYLSFADGDVDLRANYLEVISVISEQLEEGVSLRRLMGHDAPRLVASVEYFARVAKLEADEELTAACERVVEQLG